MVRTTSKKSITIALILVSCLSIAAQESDHQRVGVQKKQLAQLTTGLSFSLDHGNRVENGAGFFLSPSLFADVLYENAWSLSLSIPTSAYLGTEGIDSGHGAFAFGDPALSVGYTFRAGDWRLGTSLSYRCPIGIWDEASIKELGIASGSGYSAFGLAFNASRFLDPLILGIRLKLATTVPRTEPHGSSVKPFELDLGLSCVMAINSVAAFSFNLDPSFYTQTIRNNMIDSTSQTYGLDGSISIILNFLDYGFRIGLQKDLSNPIANPSISFDFSYIFNIEEEKNETTS